MEKNLVKLTANGEPFKINNPIKVTWDANSNMNDFKTPGVYDIYGERTVKTDNLPITNDGSGHSIAARLTVVASTLQPANNEICITQFLMLSNRIGSEGNMYVRTYNENNNGMNGWSAWQKQMGMTETLINSNDTTVGQEVFSSAVQKIGDGLNSMIDNGMYSGIYIDNLNYTGSGSLYYLSAQPTFVETFVLVVINDYAATGKLGMQRHITQLKYAVDAITGQSTVKKRVGAGNETISWGDWEDIGGSKPILWGETSNMNDYKTAGTYEIYGERTKKDDNLPITNSNPGHSISARLTVVASTLQPANNEICVTQFLMLSNRKGGDGNMYVRTYNENNSPFNNGWTLWKKFQGVEEGYIFTDTRKLNQDFGLQTYEVGLNYMVDNGNYSGVYVNEEAIIQNGELDANGNSTGSFNTDISKVKFVETFNLVVINDYAVAGQVNNMLENLGMGSLKKERQICQIKTSTDYFSGTSSIKKRVCKGNGDEYKNSENWSDWEDIGGSGEVDITDIVKAYGLPTLCLQGLAKDGIVYSCKLKQADIVNNMKIFDNGEKLSNFLLEKNNGSLGNVDLKIEYNSRMGSWGCIYIDIYGYTFYYKVVISGSVLDRIHVSADMTEV